MSEKYRTSLVTDGPLDWLPSPNSSVEVALWEGAQYTPIKAPLKTGKLYRLTVGGIDLTGCSALNLYWGPLSGGLKIGACPLVPSPDAGDFYLDATIVVRCAPGDTLHYIATAYGVLNTSNQGTIVIAPSKASIDLGVDAPYLTVTGAPGGSLKVNATIGLVALEALN